VPGDRWRGRRLGAHHRTYVAHRGRAPDCVQDDSIWISLDDVRHHERSQQGVLAAAEQRGRYLWARLLGGATRAVSAIRPTTDSFAATVSSSAGNGELILNRSLANWQRGGSSRDLHDDGRLVRDGLARPYCPRTMWHPDADAAESEDIEQCPVNRRTG
jgi:hypothetical protein